MQPSKTRTKQLLILTSMIALAGCASVPTVEESSPVLKCVTNDTLLLSIVDKRKYVLAGEKTPSYAGYSRDGFGIPHTYEVQSDQTMVAFLAERIVTGFRRQNIQVLESPSITEIDLDFLSNQARAKSADKILLIVLNEWKSERNPTEYVIGLTYRLVFKYDVDVRVFDTSGRILAERHFDGADTEPGETIQYIEQDHYKYKEKLEEFINSDEIRTAIEL